MNRKNEAKRGPVKGVKLDQVTRSEFGKHLFTIRRARGISQKELGEKVGLSLRMISYYERDTNGPPVAVLKNIASALGVSASYLLGESPLKTTVKDEIDYALKKPVETLQRLPKKQQRTAITMIEALAAKGALDEKDMETDN
jgi:transcriptional regulator with XRE-family HTH domain